jgi:membrane dipeptidase
MIRFMVRNTEPVTIEHLLDHVDYVAKLVGVEHVAVGSDLDVVGNPNAVNGAPTDPRNQPNFSRYGPIHTEKARRLSTAQRRSRYFS